MDLPRLVVTIGKPAESVGEAAQARARPWTDPAGRVVGSAGGDRDGFWILLDGVASYRFGSKAETVHAVREPGTPNQRVVDTFERGVLPFVLQASGDEVLHASAVLGPRGVVALCGESGAGKSTLAAGLGRLGLTVWADDAVAFEVDGSRVTAVGLPFRTRLLPDADECLRAMTPAPEPPGPPEPGRRERLQAIVVLNGGEDGRLAACEVARLPPELAFTALLPHAYWFELGDPQAKRRTMQRYLRLASQVPVHAARVAGLERLPELLGRLERLIRRARRAGAGGEAG